MKRLFNILILFFVVGCSESDRVEIIKSYSNGEARTVKVYFEKNDSSNYIIKDYFIDGTLVFEGRVSNSKFIEYKKAYFRNGSKKEFVELSDSAELGYCCPDGFYQTYYENGNLEETHYKKDGTFNGLVTKYDSNGTKVGEYEVTNGLRNGTTSTYYNNGNIESIKEYLNDTLIGTAYFFMESGDSLKRHGTYKGELDFPIKYWKDNGHSLLGVYQDSNYHQVKWVWRDSLDNIIKVEISDTVNGQFVTPEY